jgi:hypothetical protein
LPTPTPTVAIPEYRTVQLIDIMRIVQIRML